MKRKKTILTNGFVVTPSKILQGHAVLVDDKYIEAIIPQEKVVAVGNDVTCINCSGRYILPGLIDIHSDMIENIIVPRKGITFDYGMALFEADRQCISHGVTTIYHSISIANSTICNRERTLSVPQMLQIGDAIHDLDPELLVRHRFHARLELNTIEAYDDIIKRLQRHGIHELSLMNHTPGQGQYASLNTFKTEIKKQYGEVSDKRMNEIILECQEKPLLSSWQIGRLLECAYEQGVPVACHDVETEEQLKFMKKYGIQISEFPISPAIAAKASTMGFYNIVGAPNIIKKGSHNRNASAADLLKERYANIICSDYYSPALLSSVFSLPTFTDIPLSEAVRFVTEYPAKAVQIDSEYGAILPGKKADLIVVDNSRSSPSTVCVLVDGKKKYEVCYGDINNE